MTGRHLRASLLASAAAALAMLASGSSASSASTTSFEAVASFVAVRDASAHSPVMGGGELRVGDRLVAIMDVELDAAIVRAGSAVSVVGRKARAGNILFDVALADGHVVKSVPQIRLRSAFRAG